MLTIINYFLLNLWFLHNTHLAGINACSKVVYNVTIIVQQKLKDQKHYH